MTEIEIYTPKVMEYMEDNPVKPKLVYHKITDKPFEIWVDDQLVYSSKKEDV